MTRDELIEIIIQIGEWQVYRKGERRTPPSDIMKIGPALDNMVIVLKDILKEGFKSKEKHKKVQDLINRLDFYIGYRKNEHDNFKKEDYKQLSKDLDEALTILKAYNENTIDNLAEEQNVKPMEDVRDLFGTWPDMEDNFEETINELRHRDIAKTELEIINALMK